MTIENILITDYHCASNRGDAAILEGELAAFDRQFPDAEISITSEYPEAARLIHGIDASAQQLTPFEPGRVLKTGASAFALLDAATGGESVPLPFREFVVDQLELEPYYDADLVVSTGGQFVTDAYYPAKIGVLAGWYLAHLLEKPFVVYAQSLGPFERPYKALTRYVLDQAKLIITRDRESKRHLDEIGVSTKVHVGVDAAWGMQLSDRSVPLTENFPLRPRGSVQIS